MLQLRWDPETQSLHWKNSACEVGSYFIIYPDFVYFNHSQHVTVAGIECQTCHGPVQEYEIQKQFAPLTMSWCIDCA